MSFLSGEAAPGLVPAADLLSGAPESRQRAPPGGGGPSRLRRLRLLCGARVLGQPPSRCAPRRLLRGNPVRSLRLVLEGAHIACAMRGERVWLLEKQGRHAGAGRGRHPGFARRRWHLSGVAHLRWSVRELSRFAVPEATSPMPTGNASTGGNYSGQQWANAGTHRVQARRRSGHIWPDPPPPQRLSRQRGTFGPAAGTTCSASHAQANASNGSRLSPIAVRGKSRVIPANAHCCPG